MTGAREAEDEWDEACFPSCSPDTTLLLSAEILREQALMSDYEQSNYAFLRDDRALDKPIIAAINGTALAGGCELVQGTDIRVLADDAKIGLSEAQRGLFPAGGSSVRMPRQV